MRLYDQFVETGRWLFRWRGILPILLLPLFLVSLQHFSYPQGSHRLDMLWEVACLIISGLGFGVRVLVGAYAPEKTSGRNRHNQVAETLNTRGMYSVVRHPLYLGNFLISLGVSLILRIWWFSAIYALAYALYVERIMFAEEHFLMKKFGYSYADWAKKTPAWLPTRIRWVQPEETFSIRNALRREYRTLSAMVVAMFTVEVIADYHLRGRLVLDHLWIAILICTLVFWLVVRILDKATRLLRVEGR
jgi:protein-S-isoprenylcysteine O-methyltransferase Ste14